jgi:biotin carboxyl carrier protein
VIIKEIKAPEVIKEELIAKVLAQNSNAKQVVAPVSGIVIWELPVGEQSMPKPLGTSYKEGGIICWVSAFFGHEEVKSLYEGKLCSVVCQQGDKVKKGDIIAFVE